MGAGKGKTRRASSSDQGQTGDEAYSLRETTDIPRLGNEAHRRDLEVYARSRASDSELAFRFEGDPQKMPAPGYTDMKGNIVLANYLPEGSTDADRYLMISGVLEHELTHCRYYDPKVHERFVEEMEEMRKKDDQGAKDAAIIAQLNNVLLDGNNEERLRSEEPLAFRRISYLNKVFPRITDDIWGKNPGQPKQSLNGEAMPKASKEDLIKGQLMAAIHAEALPEWEVGEISPKIEKLFDECKPIIAKGVFGDSQDVCDAAKELYELLKDNNMQPEVNLIKQYSIGGDAQPGKEAQPGKGDQEAQGAGDGEPKSAKEREEEAEAAGAKVSDEDLEKARARAESEMDDGQEKAEAEEKENRKKGDVDGDSWKAPPNETITSEKTIRVGAGGEYASNRGRLSNYGNQLATQLAEMKTMTRERSRFQRSGRLDPHRLSKVATGRDTIFFRQGEELAVDIAASVVLDLSGSMSGHRTKLRDASIIAQVAMEKLDLPHEIWGFSGGGGGEADHYEYKSYARETAKGLGRIGNTGDSVAPGGGSTPTMQAVNFATARMKRRRESNRVMFVFTDGQPNDTQGTVRAVRNARTKGMIVIGILFEDEDHYAYGGGNKDMMAQIFGGDYVVIKEMGDMPRQIGKRLKKLIKIR